MTIENHHPLGFPRRESTFNVNALRAKKWGRNAFLLSLKPYGLLKNNQK